MGISESRSTLGIVRSIDVFVKQSISYAKLTTTSDGRNVLVRGNNPGGHQWQSLERQMIEKQDREQREHRRRVIEEEMETKRKQRERKEEMETERKQIGREEMETKRSPRRLIILFILLLAVLFLYWKISN